MMHRPSKSRRITKKLFTAPHALRQEAETRKRIRHDTDPTTHDKSRITLNLTGHDPPRIDGDAPDGEDRPRIIANAKGQTFHVDEGHISDAPLERTVHTEHTPNVEQRQLEEDHHQSTTPRSGHSAVGSGEGPGTSSQAEVIVHNRSERNYRPKRDAIRQAERSKRARVVIESQTQSAPFRGTRGPNQDHRYSPDKSKGQSRFPLYWNKNSRPIGLNSGKFGKYLGVEARNTMRYPLHLTWGPIHEASLQRFFVQVQEDYELLPKPELEDSLQRDLDYPNILHHIRGKIQDSLRGYRHTIKRDCWKKWIKTPEAEREALFQTKDFKALDRSTWDLLCEYFSDPNNQDIAKVNEGNKAHARATYTGGSRNMACATEAAEEKLTSQGITPTPLNLYLATHASSFNPETGTYTYPDEATKEYCERVVKEAKEKGVGTSAGNDPMELTKILDDIHGGHHGGYERGLGVGPARLALKRSDVPIIHSTRDQRMEETLQAQREMMESELKAQREKLEAELQAQREAQREETERLRAELRELKDMINSGRARSGADDSSASGTPMTADEVVEHARIMVENGASSGAVGRFMTQAFKKLS